MPVPIPPPTDSFFGVIDSIAGNLTNQLDSLSGALAGPNTLSTDVMLLMLCAEIIIAIILALTDSGQKAISQGVQAILYTAFVYALIASGAWSTVVIPITKSFPSEVISALGIAGDSNSVKTEVATQFSRLITNIMDPKLIQPSKSLGLPVAP